MKLKKFNDNQMDINSYLLVKNNLAVLIDPGFNGKAIYDYCTKNKIKINSILLTHGHFDHIRDVNYLNDFFDFSVYIHAEDYPFLFDAKLNFSQSFNRFFKIDKSVTIYKLKDKEKLVLLDKEFLVIHTPGHTPGSVMYQYYNKVFSGDTLFYDSIGRTDLFSGSFNSIRRSINYIKTNISNSKIIYPGHGRSGDLKTIKKINKYLQ